MNDDPETTWERLGEFVTQTMERKNVPGVSVGILHRGEAATAGFGVTSVAHPLVVTDETLFQIGSITKTFTGTAIMRLVETDKLDLDATVRTYLPDFRVADEAASAQATVRHLLTHMGGWVGDLFHDTGAGNDALASYVAAMADLEQLAPIGTVWSYNNAAFCLAGRIIEVVMEQSYREALKALVLEPLKLRNSYLNPVDVMTHRFAVGHNVGEDGPQIAHPWPIPRASNPAGGIACDVRDLLRYARFHLGDGAGRGAERDPVALAAVDGGHAVAPSRPLEGRRLGVVLGHSRHRRHAPDLPRWRHQRAGHPASTDPRARLCGRRVDECRPRWSRDGCGEQVGSEGVPGIGGKRAPAHRVVRGGAGPVRGTL
jgi:CubicO group peptidase (beta-lactamase class C family)